MDASPRTLAELLTQAGLIGATIEYAEIVRRRVVARGKLADQADMEESGLRGLVRVFAENETSEGQPRATLTGRGRKLLRRSSPNP